MDTTELQNHLLLLPHDATFCLGRLTAVRNPLLDTQPESKLTSSRIPIVK